MNGLSQKTILVTRPTGEQLSEMLTRRGARPYCHPVIRISDPANWSDVDRAIERMTDFEWLVFASSNGIERFVERARRQGRFEQLHELKIAAIGTSTSRYLEQYGLRAVLIPTQSDSLGLAEALLAQPQIQSALLIRGNRGSSVLANRLASQGIQIEEVVAYQSSDIHQSSPDIQAMLKAGQFDWVTITSSAIAAAAIALWREDLRRTRLVSISPTTTTRLLELGFAPAAEARPFNMEGMVAAMETFGTAGNPGLP